MVRNWSTEPADAKYNYNYYLFVKLHPRSKDTFLAVNVSYSLMPVDAHKCHPMSQTQTNLNWIGLNRWDIFASMKSTLNICA